MDFSMCIRLTSTSIILRILIHCYTILLTIYCIIKYLSYNLFFEMFLIKTHSINCKCVVIVKIERIKINYL